MIVRREAISHRSAGRAVLQRHIETSLKQNVVVRAKQKNRRKISQRESAVLPFGLSKLNLGIAHHREIVQRIHEGTRGLDFGRRFLGLLFRIGGQRLGFTQPLLQLLNRLLVLLVGLLVLVVLFFQLTHPLVVVGNHAFQRIKVLVADHRRRTGYQSDTQHTTGHNHA